VTGRPVVCSSLPQPFTSSSRAPTHGLPTRRALLPICEVPTSPLVQVRSRYVAATSLESVRRSNRPRRTGIVRYRPSTKYSQRRRNRSQQGKMALPPARRRHRAARPWPAPSKLRLSSPGGQVLGNLHAAKQSAEHRSGMTRDKNLSSSRSSLTINRLGAPHGAVLVEAIRHLSSTSGG
jgi:hypothetical protein